MKKRWLVISYFGNIDAMAPSHHIDDRLPFLIEKGIDIDLITSPCGAKFRNLSHIRVPSCAPSGIRYEVRHLLRRKSRKRFWFKFWETLLLLPVIPFYLLEKLFLRLDSTWSWFITSSVVATVIGIKNRPEILYSTGGPVSAHLSAMVASRITGIPYIAEFQDPLVHQYAAPGKFERHIIERVEKLIYRTARGVVFLTKKAAENARERNKDESKTFSIYAGAVPFSESVRYKKGETFSIAHFGSLGGSRNVDFFLRAWNALLSEKPRRADYVFLDLYGSTPRSVARQREQSRHKQTIRIHGKVKRQSAVSFMHKADVLLLIQNTDDVSFETIPSKVYEYLHTGRPILSLTYRNPELQGLLEQMGHLIVQADDEAGIKEGLETYISRWEENRWHLPEGKSPYSVARAVDELIAVAEAASFRGTV